jgi:nicotinamide riboside kinase
MKGSREIMKKKLLATITAVSLMSCILIPGVFADSANRGNVNNDQTQIVDKGNAKDKLNDSSKDKAEAQQWREAKDKLEAEKDALEIEKDALDSQKDALEVQYEAAKESGSTELAGQLAAQIEALKKELESKKQLMKDTQDEIKATIRSTYTSEELINIEQLSEKIKKENIGITVMPVDSIVAKGKTIKFDTPPVIKDGRTLIPVRALSEAFGATVAWDPVEQKVTISNGTTQIVLNLNSNTAYVNGTEVAIDVAATTLSNRTIVPLRFITETLGLKVDWDEETDTVEISDGTDETPTTPTTDSTTTTDAQ